MILLDTAVVREQAWENFGDWNTLLLMDTVSAVRLASLCYIASKGYEVAGLDLSAGGGASGWQAPSSRCEKLFKEMQDQLVSSPGLCFQGLHENMPRLAVKPKGLGKTPEHLLQLFVRYDDRVLVEGVIKNSQEQLLRASPVQRVSGLFQYSGVIACQMEEALEAIEGGSSLHAHALVNSSTALLKDFIAQQTDREKENGTGYRFQGLKVQRFILSCIAKEDYELLESGLAFYKELVREGFIKEGAVALSYADWGQVLMHYDKAPAQEPRWSAHLALWRSEHRVQDAHPLTEQRGADLCACTHILEKYCSMPLGQSHHSKGFMWSLERSDIKSATFFLNNMQAINPQKKQVVDWDVLLKDLIKKEIYDISVLAFVEKHGQVGWSDILVHCLLEGAKSSSERQKLETYIEKVLDHLLNTQGKEGVASLLKTHVPESLLWKTAEKDYTLERLLNALDVKKHKLRVMSFCTLAQLLGYSEPFALRLVELGSDWKFAKKQFKNTAHACEVFYQQLELMEVSQKVLKRKGIIELPSKSSMRL